MIGEDGRIASFDALLGQEKAKKILQRIIRSGRMSHAYLFRGPDGVGKRFCAQLVAAQLNCREPRQSGGCGACPSCRKYVSGSHPDITILGPENGVIKIDRVRELCRSLSYPPYESATRVVIFEDVHTMRPEAANSLLKTLEEPPEHNVLILTAESSRALLPTIISRCQIIPFYPLSEQQTTTVLGRIYPDMGQGDAHLLAKMGEGSPGRAMVLREKGLIEAYRSVLRVISAPPHDPAGSTSALLQEAERMGGLKENLQPLFGLIRSWIRDSMVSHQRSNPSEREQQIARLAAVERAERQLGANCNRTLVCEVLLFNLQSPDPQVSY